MNDHGTLTPAGKPNLTAELAPRRGTVPGAGGTILTPNMIRPIPVVPQSVDDWRTADDGRKLALAPAGDRARLAQEEGKLTAAEAAAKAAEGSCERAKAALIEARVEGRDHRDLERHYETAEAVLASAKRSAAIQRDVTATLRARLIERVRQELATTARAKLAETHRRYDDALTALARTTALVADMQAARQAEAEAAADLASALGVTPSFVGGQRAEHATGSRFVTIPPDADRLALVVDQPGDPIRLVDGAIAGHLARRAQGEAEERPALRPIDEAGWPE